jgi:2-polyprenyl-3-methyl-5-hydroxy-6-metoxy-1,4-benzoquinol methylase
MMVDRGYHGPLHAGITELEELAQIYEEATARHFYQGYLVDQYHLESYLNQVASNAPKTHSDPKPRAQPDDPDCDLNSVDSEHAAEQWDVCCSLFPRGSAFLPIDDSCQHCCTFRVGSPNHLRLPAFHELALRLQLPSGHMLELEQDGTLRPLDSASVLYPGGYLLALFVSSQAPELRFAQRALELGAGVGAPSIALALQGTPVVATDIAPHALALVLAHASAHGVSNRVQVAHLNYTDLAADRAVQETYGSFDVVLDSSLQALFSNTADPSHVLWSVLDILLHPKGLAVFVHTANHDLYRMQPPSDGRYTGIGRCFWHGNENGYTIGFGSCPPATAFL